MNNKRIGFEGEQMAVSFLKENGHIILEQNYQIRGGEIDIISIEPQSDNKYGVEKYFVFTEVKYRSTDLYGKPYEFVNDKKQAKISFVALHYLRQHKLSLDTPIRFDVISIEGEYINWIKNAYEFFKKY